MSKAVVGLVVSTAACALMGSCNILGPAGYLAFGQPKAPALYEPQDRSTVVFVDDRNNAIPMNATRIRREIADKVSTDLMEQGVITDMISSRDAMATARNRDRDGELMSIDELGAAVGAQQVIYVSMISFQGSPDGYSPKPTASCRLKVIDVPNRTRLFPGPDADQPFFPVTIESPAISPDLYTSNEARRQIESILALMLGDQIAKLFYKHVPDELGTRLTPQ
ncbi:MAG: hypothetical protein ACYS1E_08820 [Planctomycetota bacterium]|jgi:hypothetical protein